jgi:anti-sigma B factor antagonist
MSHPIYKHIQCDMRDGVLVMTITESHLQGDTLADAFRREMFESIAHHSAKKVVIDFQNVKYLSSAAFRPLLSLRRSFQTTGGQFLLCGLSPVIEEVFLVTRLISTSGSSPAPFEREADVAAAVARLKAA